MPSCRICRSSRMQFVIDFGRLAITNQFLTEGSSAAYRQPMSWHECLDCGVVQLAEVPPVEQIQCRFPWLTYKEPEHHLDETAEVLIRLARLQAQHRIIGLSKEDSPLIKRLGPCQSLLIDPIRDLGTSEASIGVETIQSGWTAQAAHRAVQRFGTADVLIARYILEHAQNTAEFLTACRTMLAPDGILMVEVPDCAQAFRDLDVTVLWEEHVLYFTEQSLRRSMAVAGFELLHFQRVLDSMEDRLVWIGRAAAAMPGVDGSDQPDLAADPDVKQFAMGWPDRRRSLRSWAESIRRDGGRLAIFGAGHRACTLVDCANIAKFVDCVVDDTKEKQMHRFPAGELPIFRSAALVERGITCCLLAVNPEIEDRILERNSQFVAAGGTFVSCYPRSKRALRF